MRHILLVALVLAAGCGNITPRPRDLSPGEKPSAAQVEAAVLAYLQETVRNADSIEQVRITRGPRAREWQNTYTSPWMAGWLVCFEYSTKTRVKPGAVTLRSGPNGVSVIEKMLDPLVPRYC